ncbi:MAG: hypothetical protein EP343_07690 [Deltaproteobacteria bacterium]|nr:MAG: hypothetical protein EP343_07690 [Deltaproteobacteria bacterium]
MAHTRSFFADRVVLTDPATQRLQLQPGCLEVNGATISFAQAMTRDEWKSRCDEQPETQALDLGDVLVTPAFINAHTHLAMVVFRGLDAGAAMARNVVEDLYFTVESQLSNEDVRAFARLGAFENLLHGVGTVWEHYYGGTALADALVDAGLTGVVAPTLQDVAGPGVNALDSQWDATLAIHESEAYAQSGVLAAWGPHATDTVSNELWQRIGRAANEHNLPVHVHVAQSIEEYTFSMETHNLSPVARLQHLDVLEQSPHSLLVHGIYINQDDFAHLKSGRQTLGFCPYSQAQYAFPANVLRWTEADIPWLVATDCAACNDSMNVQKEMRFVHGMRVTGSTWAPEYQTFFASGKLSDATRLQEHRTRSFHATERFANPEFLLSLVWSNPGRMHPAMKVGHLQADYLANFVIWDPMHPSMWPSMDPLRLLALSDTTPAIQGMMVNGQWIGERGDFARSVRESDAYQDALQEANERLTALQKRL